MTSSLKVIIIVPVYNEADVILSTLTELLQATENIPGFLVDILVFDSHSTDGGPELLAELQKTSSRIQLASEPKKTGLGSAYHQAFQMALEQFAADIIFEFDADGSHKPAHIPHMLAWMTEGADVIVGSRYVSGGSIPKNWAWHRKFLSIAGNLLCRIILTPRYKDFTSGFRATRAKFLKQALPKKFLSSQYAYKLELFWRLHQAGAKIREYPIHFIDREQGDSKFPKNNLLDSLRVIFTLRLRSFYETRNF